MDADAEYRCIVPFPDQSPSFVHGFEAGRVWFQMERGDHIIEGRALHTENAEVLQRMAAVHGYDVEREPTEFSEWTNYTFTKRRSHLSVVSERDDGKVNRIETKERAAPAALKNQNMSEED